MANQRELAAAVGIQGATLTQHLNTMENDGLLTRRRDPSNRRVHLVELTENGDSAFLQMREAAGAFDRQLRAGLDEADTAHLAHLLDRLHDNIAGPAERPPAREGSTPSAEHVENPGRPRRKA